MVSEVKFTAEDLSWLGAQREGDGSGRGVLQIFQGHGQSEGRGPGLQDARLETTLHFIEDSNSLRVAVVTVHLQEEDADKTQDVRRAFQRPHIWISLNNVQAYKNNIPYSFINFGEAGFSWQRKLMTFSIV